MAVCLENKNNRALFEELQDLERLKGERNLLAFSAGVDSTALYFLLRACGIPFDVVIVDYGIRVQSSLEVSRAKLLSFLDRRQCYVREIPKITTDFENNARKARYEFFEELIVRFGYTHLILAHQLNDALEWFLMQFCKGTSGHYLQMPSCYKKQGLSGEYYIVRPLLRVSRNRILRFLQENEIFYFEDFSNANTDFLRNDFRMHFSNPLLARFEKGILFSLENLCNGQERILKDMNALTPLRILPLPLFFIFKLEPLCALEQIDRACKICGVLLSRKQKLNITGLLGQQKFSISQGKVAIEKNNQEIFVFPVCAKEAIPKIWREKYRLLRIPNKFRIFLETARKLGKAQEIFDRIQDLRSENEKGVIDSR